MATVDSLDIKIQSEAKSAEEALDSLIKKIGKVATAMTETLNANGFDVIGNGVDSVADKMESLKNSMKGISASIDPQIGQLTKTITRLANAGDKSSQVSDSLPKIGNALKKMTNDMSKIGSVDSGVNKLVSSIARLANAGDKSAIAAKELPRLGDALKQITKSMKDVNGISDSTNTFAQTISQLANAGDKVGKAASGLGELSQKTLEFFNAMKNAPQISENTIRMTQAMAQLSSTGGRVSDVSGKIAASMKPMNSIFETVSKAADKMAKSIKAALKVLANIVGGAFSKIGQIGLKAANSMKRVAGDMVAAFSRINHSSKGLKTVSLNLGNLLKTIVGFKGIQGILNFGKSALEFGSDITEVENVVDVAFGSMRQHAYDFASTAKEQFGLSELAAKQYSGTMMAMLKSSGVMQSEAAEMSTTLAGLAGDLASFYNIETDEAFYKLRAAISGETEPMKQLGVNMNVVNLEAFALSRGINKAYKDMTLAEQATLRYNYILAKTTDAQGDFARTADSYANQIRLLKLNFQSLSGVIGQGLIAGILPAIKALNMLMSKLMQAATVFRNFMYTLVGKKLQGSTSGIVNDLAGIGDSSEGLNDLGDAAEEAGNKLKKKLFTLPFDELNILSEDSDSLSDSLGDIGNIDIGMDGLDDLFDTDVETPINIWAKRIRDAFLAHDWEGLGSTIAELLNKGLQKIYDVINWNNLGQKITEFVEAFTRTFNSLADKLDWDLLGRTVGAGINTLANTFNQFIEKINFENLGAKLSTGLRGMLAEVDWQNLGNLLGNYFMVAWRLFEGFLDGMWRENSLTGLNGFQELGISLAEGIYGIFEKIDLGRIGAAISSIFNGIFETMQSFVDEMESKGTWQKIADNISQGLNNAISGIKPVEAAQALGKFVTDLLGTMLSVAESTPWDELGHKIGQFLINIPWSTIFWQVFDIITNVLGGLFGGLATEILYNFDRIGAALADGFNEAFERLKVFTLSVDWNAIAENIYIGLNNMIHGINWADAGKTLSDFVKKLIGVFWEVAQNTDWEALGRGIGEFLSNIDWWGILKQVFDTIGTILSGLIDGLGETTAGKVLIALGIIAAAIKGFDIVSGIVEFVNKAAKTFGLLPEGVSSVVPLVIDKLKRIGTGLIDDVVPLISTGVSKIVGEGGLFSKLFTGASGLVSKIGPVLSSIGSVIFSPTGLLIAGIAAGVVLIIANWDKIKEAAGKVKDWVVEKWEGIKEKTSEIWGNIKSFIGNTWDNIKSWASEKFGKAEKDISDTWSKVEKKTSDTWDGIKKTAGDKIPGIIGDISNKFSELPKTLDKTGKSAIDSLGKGMESQKGIISGKAKEVADTMDKELTGLNFEKIGGDMMNSLSEGIGKSKNVLQKAASGISDIFSGVVSSIGNAMNKVNSTIGNLRVGASSRSGYSSYSVPQFATGGFPEDGLFFANHNELVGQFTNGQTAVANNAQIVDGIKYGVKEAVTEVLAPYLADIVQNTRETADKDMSVRIGDRDIVSAYNRGSARQGYSFSS